MGNWLPPPGAICQPLVMTQLEKVGPVMKPLRLIAMLIQTASMTACTAEGGAFRLSETQSVSPPTALPSVTALSSATPALPTTPLLLPTTAPAPTASAVVRPLPTPTSTPAPADAIATKEHEAAMTDQLIQAAERGDTEIVLQLLQAGADINGRDARSRTPVMAATHGNQVDTVRALIQAGADINLRDNRMDNPFLYAGAEGLLDILKLTIEAGADTKLTNRFGGTALIPAAERGHVEIVQELLTRTDVDVNHVNNLGWTALLEAIILGEGGPRHTEVVRLLVEAGADVNLADANGVTPLAHARQHGYRQMIEILQKAGAR